MNIVIIKGRLTKDVKMSYVGQSQMAKAQFTVAVDRPVRQGEEKKADFIQVTVWGKQAENCDKYVGKGCKVTVQGRLQTGQYQDKDGKTVYTQDVVAEKVEFDEFRKKEEAPEIIQEAPPAFIDDDDL